MKILKRRSRRPRPSRRAWELDPIVGRTRPGAVSTVGVLVYRGVTSAELDEPVTLLADRLDADVALVGAQRGPVHAVEPARTVVAGHDPTTAPAIDVLVVPGGLGWKQVIGDPAVRNWLAVTASSARAVLAMSTGSLLLASVGRLEGRDATGHWLAEADLAALGAQVVSRRVVSDDAGRVVTASGALAAIPVIDDLADHARWADLSVH